MTILSNKSLMSHMRGTLHRLRLQRGSTFIQISDILARFCVFVDIFIDVIDYRIVQFFLFQLFTSDAQMRPIPSTDIHWIKCNTQVRRLLLFVANDLDCA